MKRLDHREVVVIERDERDWTVVGPKAAALAASLVAQIVPARSAEGAAQDERRKARQKVARGECKRSAARCPWINR